MPLSGSHWAPPLADFMLPQGHQPKRLNEVNPVKRKMTWDTQLQACNGEQMLTESMEHIAKRQCKDNNFAKNIFPSSAYQPHEQYNALADRCPDGVCDWERKSTHPFVFRVINVSVPGRLKQGKHMEVPSLYGCLKYTTAPLEQSDSQSEISSKSQLLPFENNLLMDLSDETYSSSKHDEELDSVHSAMESDSLPESQQHRNIGYCSTPCPGGERSPNSNRVRCYCRPVLDPIFDALPYCSDYY